MLINGERSLAYIAKITNIEPIEGADRIEHATINDGWKVVVAKQDGFKVGDEVVYIEIDSKVPAKPVFEFLSDRKYRVKTIKLRGAYSQGLVMPRSVFPEIEGKKLGEDVSKDLGITYYVPEDNDRKASGPNPKAKYNSRCARHKNLAQKGWWRWLMKREWGRKLLFAIYGKKNDKPLGFPTKFPYIKKTDEERCENMPWVLGYKDPLIVTEKLDGTSCTYIMEKTKGRGFEFWVLSRNVRQMNEDQKCFHDSNIYWELAGKYDIEAKLKQYMLDNPSLDYVCIQGEGVGNVQGNPLKLNEDRLYLFNFIRSDIGRLSPVDGLKVAASMGLKWVPILDANFHVPSDMEEFKKLADGRSVVNVHVAREGFVLRDPKTDLSFKNVSREYLQKHE